jgi:hypothetical protein
MGHSGNRTHDIAACSIVPQPITLPRNPNFGIRYATQMKRELDLGHNGPKCRWLSRRSGRTITEVAKGQAIGLDNGHTDVKHTMKLFYLELLCKLNPNNKFKQQLPEGLLLLLLVVVLLLL